MKKTNGISTLALALAATASGQTGRESIEISTRIAPAGRFDQVKVQLSSPRSGGLTLTGAWAVAEGASLLGDGEAFGTALQNGDSIDVHFVGNNALLAVNFRAGDAERGPVKSGGGIAIRNVVPGGGMLPAGALITLLGAGFRPDTQVKLAGLPNAPVSYISSSEMQIALPAAARMDGLRIIAKNADDSAAEYVVYWRGVPQGDSADPLLARAIPLFGAKTTRSAHLPGQVLTRLDASYVLGLALQNPGLEPAEITMAMESGRSVRIVLPPGARISREIGELFGAGTPPGAAVTIQANQPIQILGLWGDRRAGKVLPVALAVE